MSKLVFAAAVLLAGLAVYGALRRRAEGLPPGLGTFAPRVALAVGVPVVILFFNARVSASLTQTLIQQQYLSKWDGRLPQYTFGGNAVPFVQLPASASGTPDGPRR
jgi:hypothetical protein